MVNRTLQQKTIKMRRRNRYARFSGGDIKIAFGKISLSKQTISTGQSVRREESRMLRPADNDPVTEFPKTLGLSIGRELAERLASVLRHEDLPKLLHHRIIDGRKVKVFVFYTSRLDFAYLLRVDERRCKVERSYNFRTIEAAQEACLNNKDVWLQYSVERMSSAVTLTQG